MRKVELIRIADFTMADYVLGLSWSPDGTALAAVPSTGPILVADAGGRIVRELPGHGPGNGAAVFHPSETRLATCGSDGKIRLYEPLRAFDGRGRGPVFPPSREISLGKGWLERLAWSPDGLHLATALGRSLVVMNGRLEILHEFPDHKSTVCDFAWNPCAPDEIASVCDGGAHMWRLGEPEPFARFDWGGASLLVAWSPDGRWIVTGDQTPSVHLYDFTRDHPLHIQGYATKVKALAFNSAARKLATGGGPLVTVWNCTGKNGPEGTTPRQLDGHHGDTVALEYRNSSDLLASGGTDGLLLLFEPESSTRPRAVQPLESAITSVRWHPANDRLAVGTESGIVAIFDVA